MSLECTSNSGIVNEPGSTCSDFAEIGANIDRYLSAMEGLSVDDPIDSYFDDVPEDKRAITLHQLLTHSSGLTGGVGPDDEPIEARAYVGTCEPTEACTPPWTRSCSS